MAKLAVINATAGIVTSIEAVAAGCDLVACELRDAPADADVVIVDCGERAPVDADVFVGGAAPVLLLVDRGVAVSASLCDAPQVSLLRKPFDLFELRLELRRLLDAAPEPVQQAVAAAIPSPATLDWLASPLVPASTVPTLQAALRLAIPVLLAGESGTGRQRVAGALLQRRRPAQSLVSWHAGEDLSWLMRKVAGDAGDNVLFVPGIDARPPGDQRRLEELVSMHPGLAVIATAGDDPGKAVVAGTLSRSLYHLLARVAVRLPPLRERRSDIAPLAQLFADALAAQCCNSTPVTFTDAACEKLELYEWPGNLPELEGVIARSVIAATSPGRGAAVQAKACLLDAPDLLFAPALCAAGFAGGAASGTRRSAVVLPLTGDSLPQPAGPAASPTAIEPVLAALAHDLRNPMTTLKTFAALAAQQGGVDAGSSELAREAVDACTRIDTHIELLSEYATLSAPEAGEIDLVAVFAEAIEEAPLPVSAAVHARLPVLVRADARHARFIATAILEESRERLGTDDEAWVDTMDSASEIEVRIPRGGRAIEHLGRWLEGEAWPWRLALAREVARRGGGELELQVDEGELRVRWRAPLAEEVRNGEAGRIDRRRRSRSS